MVRVIVIDILLLYNIKPSCVFNKGRNTWSKVPWIWFFICVCQKYHTYIKELVYGVCLHILIPQWNSTLTFILSCQFGWSPPRQLIKSLLSWNYAVSKNSLFNSQVFHSLCVSLSWPCSSFCPASLCSFTLLFLCFSTFSLFCVCEDQLIDVLFSRRTCRY